MLRPAWLLIDSLWIRSWGSCFCFTNQSISKWSSGQAAQSLELCPTHVKLGVITCCTMLSATIQVQLPMSVSSNYSRTQGDDILCLDPYSRGNISIIYVWIHIIKTPSWASVKLAWECDVGIHLSAYTFVIPSASLCKRHST